MTMFADLGMAGAGGVIFSLSTISAQRHKENWRNLLPSMGIQTDNVKKVYSLTVVSTPYRHATQHG